MAKRSRAFRASINPMMDKMVSTSEPNTDTLGDPIPSILMAINALAPMYFGAGMRLG